MRATQLPEFEREFHESQLIVLDTLEKCLSSQVGLVLIAMRIFTQSHYFLYWTFQAPEAPKYDDVMNVKLLLKEICQFLDLPAAETSGQVASIRNLASKVS